MRLKAVQLVVEQKVAAERVAELLGPSAKTIREWVEAYAIGGLDALTPQVAGAPAKRESAAQTSRREAVVAVRQEHPEWGSRRIRDVLARFEGLGVSETEVASKSR